MTFKKEKKNYEVLFFVFHILMFYKSNLFGFQEKRTMVIKFGTQSLRRDSHSSFISHFRKKKKVYETKRKKNIVN